MSTKTKSSKRNNISDANDSTIKEIVEDVFEQLEPFFEAIFVKMSQLGVSHKASYCDLFNKVNANTQGNIYECTLEALRNRIRKGFEVSINELKKNPVDSNFPSLVKKDLDKWTYAKNCIVSLFNGLAFGAAIGCEQDVNRIIKEEWNSEYLDKLNNTFQFLHNFPNSFTESRKNGNVESVLNIKDILKLYDDYEKESGNRKNFINDFKKAFVDSSKRDYEQILQNYFSGDIHSFLINARTFTMKEDKRINDGVIDVITNDLVPLFKHHFVEASFDRVLEQLKVVLEKDDYEEINALIVLYERLDEVRIQQIADRVKNHFTLVCQNKIEDSIKSDSDFGKKPVEVTKLVFEFLDKLEDMQKNYFNSHPIFKKYLDNAFKDALITNKLTALNDKRDQIFLHYLASYANQLLRKGSKIEPDQEKMKENIVRIGKMLQFVGNRDIFERQYMKNFQDRLVNEAVESIDLEMFTINELSNICDRQVSYKLRQINQEYQKSGELSEKFKTHAEKNHVQLPKFDFSFVVFSKPTDTKDNDLVHFNVPVVLQNLFDRFNEFYKGQNNRKLMLNQKSTFGIIQFLHSKRPIQIVSRFFQMGIFLCFNDHKEITFAKLGELTGLSSDNLALNLSGIVSKGVLECSTGKEFFPDSVIKFNLKFKPRLAKFSVQAPDKSYAEKEKNAEQQAFDAALEESRNDVIRARQVRIMKQRRTMKYLELVNETVESLRSRFNVTSRAARINIEYLINKEYFKRSENDRETLEYLA